MRNTKVTYKFINNFSVISQSTKYISSLIPDSYDYMGMSYKMKIFSKALGFSEKYSNARWICSFLPEEINDITNNPKISKKKIFSGFKS